MRRLLLWTTVVCVGCGACQNPSPRLNAPPHGEPEITSDMQGEYVHMTDNALLADMTVSDFHFVTDRAKLTTLGEERVARLAALIEIYGGTVRFNTTSDNKPLVDARLKEIERVLAEAGVDTTGEHAVVLGMPESTGMPADQAVLIKQNEGTYKPKKGSGGGSQPEPSAPSGMTGGTKGY